MIKRVIILCAVAVLCIGCSTKPSIAEAAPPNASEAAPSKKTAALFYVDNMQAADIRRELIRDEQQVGDWVYFLYPHRWGGHALLRWREDGTGLEPVSTRRCDEYTAIDGTVYFAEYSASGGEHGELVALHPYGERILLANELCNYQIIAPHIYYAHSFDTIGVGIEGHALHRIDLDGGNHMVVAYETVGPGVGGVQQSFRVEGAYAYLSNIHITMGEPATGAERVERIAPLHGDFGAHEGMELEGWIYYSSNALYKCREDGSEQVRLDGDENSWIQIHRLDDEWIYYGEVFGSESYKIRRDGTGKTLVDYETARSAG